jgi:hypothetical protein
VLGFRYADEFAIGRGPIRPRGVHFFP